MAQAHDAGSGRRTRDETGTPRRWRLAKCHWLAGSLALCAAASCRPSAAALAGSDGEVSGPLLELGPTLAGLETGTLPPTWGDSDGDGLPDLPLYRNEGAGRFAELPGLRAQLALGNFHSAAWGDYDRDGRPDLVLTPYAEFHPVALRLLHNEGGGVFTDVAPALGLSIAGFGEEAVWADFDGDGWLDLFVPCYGHSEPFRSFLFLNEQDGGFREVAEDAGVAMPYIALELRPEGATAADWDGDGDVDLYVASHLFLNDGRARFTDVREAVGLPELFDEGAAFVDYDEDGDLDLYVRGLDTGHLFRNGGGRFVEVTAEAGIPPPLGVGWGDSWGDVDNDGDLDLLYSMSLHNPAVLLLNRGDGTFAADPAFDALALPVDNSAWGDLDGDGDLDLAAGAHRTTVVVNRLELGSPPRSSLTVRVLDADGGPNEHRAVARLTAVDRPGRVMTRVVAGGGTYLAQNDYPLLFGVDPGAAHRLEVWFPNAPTPVTLERFIPAELPGRTLRVHRDGRIIIAPP